MTAQAFKAALHDPEGNASDVKIHGLIFAGGVGGRGLPTIAGHYLEAFCNTRSSLSRRRWTGMALAVMLEASSNVVENIKAMRTEMQQVGEVILGNNEPEDIKIVAGLLMRQAIEHGIEFECFWKSNEAKTRAERFPTELGPRWMGKFQEFLDDLTDLVETNPLADPCILYPISLTASDGFRWVDPKDGISAMIVQNELLTILTPGPSIRDIQFIEIPAEHIQSTHSQPSTLYASQAQALDHEPWDLILTFAHQPWTYMLDSERRTATDFTLLFQHSTDARECEKSIKDIQQIASRDLKNSTAFLQSGILGLKSRSHSSASLHEQVQSSSDQLGKTPAPDHNQSKMTHTASDPHVAVQPRIITDQVDPGSNQQQSGVPKEGQVALAHSTRKRKRRIKEQSIQADHAASTELGEVANSSSFNGTPASPGISAKQIPSTQGKLPKVSQQAKKRISQLLEDPEDIFALQKDSRKKPSSTRQSGLAAKADLGSTPHTQLDTKPRRLRGTKIQSNDDSYTPSKAKLAKTRSGKRKPGTIAAGIAKQPKKSTQAKRVAVIENHLEQIDDPLLTVAPSRTPLIGALLGSQALTHTQKAPFKKPSLPTRELPLPSTPVQNRPKIQLESLTPTDVRKRPNASASRVASSPPIQHIYGLDDERLQGNCADTKILSSNSKPVPASPNAESTAISGHADCEDVEFEKQEGDLQTAKSDPFKQRRAGQKKTSFLRRLTGDDLGDVSDPVLAISHDEMNAHISSDGEDSLNQIDRQSVSLPKTYPEVVAKPTEVVETVQRLTTPARGNDHSTPFPQKTPEEINWVVHQQSKQPNKRKAEDDIQRTSFDSDKKAKVSAVGCGISTKLQNMTVPSSPIGGDIQGEMVSSGSTTRQIGEDLDFEGDTTLVNTEFVKQIDKDFAASPLQFRSSPPVLDSPSSHSSTSVYTEAQAYAPGDAEEMEWEASLQPHQRALHDLLIRVSKRVLRHIVDHETAVTDIADVFASDGDFVLNEVVQRHKRQSAELWKDMEQKKRTLRKEMEAVARELIDQRKRVADMG